MNKHAVHWSHLPNAAYIDWAISSLASDPYIWSCRKSDDWTEEHMSAWDRDWDTAWNEAWLVVLDKNREIIWHRVTDEAYQVAEPSRRHWQHDNSWINAWDAFRSMILALLAYDDCTTYLKLSLDKLNMLYQLNEQPACLLLQPGSVVFTKLCK